MENKYNLVINASINILKAFVMIAMVCFGIIVYTNSILTISKVWNLCFLSSIVLIFFASVIQLIICFWRVGKTGYSEEKTTNRKSNLVFSSCITFMAFILSIILYVLFTIIFFS